MEWLCKFRKWSTIGLSRIWPVWCSLRVVWARKVIKNTDISLRLCRQRYEPCYCRVHVEVSALRIWCFKYLSFHRHKDWNVQDIFPFSACKKGVCVQNILSYLEVIWSYIKLLNLEPNNLFYFFLWHFGLFSGHGLLIVEVWRSHSDTPYSVWLLRTSYQPDAGISTWQHTTLKRGRHPKPQAGFELEITISERPQTNAVYRVVSGIGFYYSISINRII
jgi:hypothetical protein